MYFGRYSDLLFRYFCKEGVDVLVFGSVMGIKLLILEFLGFVLRDLICLKVYFF